LGHKEVNMARKLRWSDVGELVAEIKRNGLTFQEGARKAGVSVWKLYEYNRRQKMPGKRRRSTARNRRAAGRASGRNGSGGAANSVGKATTSSCEEAGQEATETRGRKKLTLPAEVVELIATYKKENPLHGFRRIEQWLKAKHLIVVPRKRIRQVLKEQGLLQEGDGVFDRVEEPKGTRRFEALYPRQLWQMDHTNVYIEGLSVLYLVVIEDDYSRFCVGASLEPSCDGETMIGVVHNAISRYGKPEKLLTDQGACYYSWSMEQTRFQRYLDDMKIEHIVADPHSPQTLGKTERFHQTTKQELLRKVRFRSYEHAREEIGSYVSSYNFERVHQGLGGARPADRFFGLVGEKERVEHELCSREIDFSRGYLILTTGGRTVSVASGAKGLQVYLDGVLLKGRERDDDSGR
jgi:transposase InsO family protein